MALDRAAGIANRLNAFRPNDARFFAEVEFERADTLLLEGQFIPAGAILNSQVLKGAIALIATVSRVRWEVTFALLSLANAAGSGESPVGLDMLRDALSRPRSCGSSRLALHAMHGIAVYLAHCGLFDEATRAIQTVIALATRFPNMRVRAQTLVEAADVLTITSGSSDVIKLMDDAGF